MRDATVLTWLSAPLASLTGSRIATDGPTFLHARSRSSILLCCLLLGAAVRRYTRQQAELLVVQMEAEKGEGGGEGKGKGEGEGEGEG